MTVDEIKKHSVDLGDADDARTGPFGFFSFMEHKLTPRQAVKLMGRPSTSSAVALEAFKKVSKEKRFAVKLTGHFRKEMLTVPIVRDSWLGDMGLDD